MIIPSSSFASVSFIKKSSAAAGGDVTPNAVNWSDVSYNNDFGEYVYANQQITGISTTITLQVQIANGSAATLYYYVSNFADDPHPDGGSILSPTYYGMNSIANNGTFTVSNNQYVTFGVETGCTQTPVVTVKNQSDSNATLDTFAIEHLGEC